MKIPKPMENITARMIYQIINRFILYLLHFSDWLWLRLRLNHFTFGGVKDVELDIEIQEKSFGGEPTE